MSHPDNRVFVVEQEGELFTISSYLPAAVIRLNQCMEHNHAMHAQLSCWDTDEQTKMVLYRYDSDSSLNELPCPDCGHARSTIYPTCFMCGQLETGGVT
jgi:hypothetical protein